ARWLLETTTRSVTDIALDAGFSDCAHFSRQFKALHGLSPSLARPALRREAAIPAAEPAWADHDRVAVGASECAGQRTF
ncbi:MAG: helix-turn-helix domain-containing protein, partial [Proteobacteria bacterium]|nr:helix-turn-helix domain-containing protein [Pseudomonadota bacterium]